MAAMIGGDEEAVRELAEECDVDVANLNAPGQIVLSGSEEGIAKALEGAKAKGIRLCKELPVAGAYHSRLMASAQEKLASELASVELSEPTVPVISNVSAEAVKSSDEIKQTLESQVTGSVRWSESMRLLLDQGHEQFIELGPGKVLAGLMNRIEKGTKVVSITDVDSLDAALETL